MKRCLKNFLWITFLSCIVVSSYAVTFSNPKKTIVVSEKSPVFIIRMVSNPTTGYSWVTKKFDKRYLKLTHHEYIRPKQSMPGAPGYEEWIFRVKPLAFKKLVDTQVIFFYARPWEKKVARKVVFTISTKMPSTT